MTLAADVFLSLPSDKVSGLTELIKTASAAAQKTDGCDALIPSPVPPAIISKFTSSSAVAAADPAKVKAFADKAGPAVKALPKQEMICLPPIATLEQFSLAQLDLAGSADPDLVKAFDSSSKLAGKTIPASKLIGLAGPAKKLPDIKTAANGEELAQQKRLKAAGGALEKALKKASKEALGY